ncbi:MAG: dihydrolipoyl dehydrogenase, partial [Planctomycetes bacterium]|nr:dihydrolipoyl dehydrogenase [Planctomycetota bacterium]
MYDLIIIGAGPGGYIAAERAGHAGKKVLLIEKAQLGGVCLNSGCIPTKALLNTAKRYYEASHSEEFGVSVENISYNLELAQKRKATVQDGMRKGIAGLMKKFKVEVLQGTAKIIKAGVVVVDGAEYEAKDILVATGSSPAKPPIPGADADHVVDSTGILDITSLPESLAIIGGGVIGIEFACYFGSLGIPVTVIEMMDEICPGIDGDISKILRDELKKKNITIHLKSKVTRIEADGVCFEKAGKEEKAVGSLCLMATGRVPNSRGMGLEDVAVELERGFIRIDEQGRTNVPGVWACGDITGKVLLAHVASRQAEVVVNTIVGRSDRMRYNAIPGVVYTSPEVGGLGATEADLKKDGVP